MGEEKLVLDTVEQSKILEEVKRVVEGNGRTIDELSLEIEAIAEDKVAQNSIIPVVCTTVEGELNQFWLKHGPVTETAVDEALARDLDYFRETGFWNKLEKDIHEVACAFIKEKLGKLKEEIES